MSRGSLNGSIVYTVGDHGPGSDTGNCEAMAQFEATRELVGRPLVPFYIGDTDEVNESLETFNER